MRLRARDLCSFWAPVTASAPAAAPVVSKQRLPACVEIGPAPALARDFTTISAIAGDRVGFLGLFLPICAVASQ